MPRANNEHKEHKYLCSNPNCRKVFSRPKIIKYQVCPACQTLVSMGEVDEEGDVAISLASEEPVELKKREMGEVDEEGDVAKELRRKEGKPKASRGPTLPETRELMKLFATATPSTTPELIETSETPQSNLKKPEGDEKAILPEQVQTRQQEKVENPPVQPTKRLEEEPVSPSSSNCRYGFGYLGQRKKSEEIPDMCIECPRSLDCMLSEYYKKQESVAEIKKWYAIGQLASSR